MSVLVSTHLCKQCKQTKDISEFYLVNSTYPRSYCIPCYSARSLEGFRKHPEWSLKIKKNRAKKRNALPFSLELTWRFNLTVDELFKIYNKHKGRCAICEKLPGKNRLSLDHDHRTGKPRQFLCSVCNTAVGIIENTARLEKIQNYLKVYA